MHRSVSLLALAALSLAGLSALRKTHAQRLHATPRSKPQALQTWEGEGGGLPSGGPGQTVTPTVSAPVPQDDTRQEPSS
jgi:hypothetical protein